MMPTLVAVDMMPMYIGAASIIACAIYGNFEQHHVEGGFVLFVVVFFVKFGLVAVAVVAYRKFCRGVQPGVSKLCQRDDAAIGLVPDSPVIDFVAQENLVQAACHPETERESAGEPFAACTGNIGVVVYIAVVGVIVCVVIVGCDVVFLAFGEQGVCRGAFVFVGRALSNYFAFHIFVIVLYLFF